MTESLTDQLFSELSGAPMRQIAGQLGLGQAQTAGALSAALPLLLGALGRNASQPQGAEALFGALSRDHADGAASANASGGFDLGGLLGAVLGGGQTRQTNGAGILGHIFGQQEQRVESALGQTTGLGSQKSAQLLQILAPIVMSFLAKQMFQGQGRAAGESAPTAQSLGGLLGREQQQVRQQGGLGGGLLGAVLDQDGDGNVDIGDLLKLGSGLFGNQR